MAVELGLHAPLDGNSGRRLNGTTPIVASAATRANGTQESDDLAGCQPGLHPCIVRRCLPLRQVEVRLLDLDSRLRHRTTQRVIQDRDLRTGQLDAAPDQQEHEQEENEQSHWAKG